MSDQLAGIDTDALVKRDGKWQFRNERTKAEDECGPSEEEYLESVFQEALYEFCQESALEKQREDAEEYWADREADWDGLCNEAGV